MDIPTIVRACQGVLKLPVDGIPGTQTWTAIYVRLVDAPPSLLTLSVPTMVKAAQNAMGIPVDGIAGPGTWVEIYARLVAPPKAQILVIDLNHYNAPLDMDRVWDAGVRVIWHKASQGAHFQDPLYRSRRKAALVKGFKWGVYHFSSGHPVRDQLDNLFDMEPGSDKTIAYALDWENSTDGTANMSVSQAREFVQGLQDKTGDAGWVYGSNLVREGLSGAPDAVMGATKLWIADPRATPAPAPRTWPHGWTLLQTKEGTFAGITGCDLNVSPIPDAQFLTRWPFRA